MSKPYLAISIDHVATLRQARGTSYPEPIHAAATAELAGADGIVVHLREDRRHIQDRDIYLLSHTIGSRLNLKMALSDEMVNFAVELAPAMVTLVPESADELTSEGGMDVIANQARIEQAVEQLGERGVKVMVLVDADNEQIAAASEAGVDGIELHTGFYSEALDEEEVEEALDALSESADHAQSLELYVSAGGGLNYHNVAAIAAIDAINEINVGHAVVSRAIFAGLEKAIADFKAEVNRA